MTERECILDRLAKSMMRAELERHAKGLEEALLVWSETERTYKRLLSSKEAQRLLELMEKYGLTISLGTENLTYA